MIKLSLRLASLLCLIVPAFSYAATECSGVNFDIYANPAHKTIALVKEEQQYHTVFDGTQEGHVFKIVIMKESMDVNGYIKTADGVDHSFKGSFSSEGRFEFSSMSGGNIMMPAKLIGLTCLKN